MGVDQTDRMQALATSGKSCVYTNQKITPCIKSRKTVVAAAHLIKQIAQNQSIALIQRKTTEIV